MSVSRAQCKITHHGDIEFHSGINLDNHNERIPIVRPHFLFKVEFYTEHNLLVSCLRGCDILGVEEIYRYFTEKTASIFRSNNYKYMCNRPIGGSDRR